MENIRKVIELSPSKTGMRGGTMSEFDGAVPIDDEFAGAIIVKPKPAPILRRMARGALDTTMGIGQLLNPPLFDETGKEIGTFGDFKKIIDKENRTPEGMDWARMAGNALNPTNWMGGAAGATAQGFLGPTEEDGAAGIGERIAKGVMGYGVGEVLRPVVSQVLQALRPRGLTAQSRQNLTDLQTMEAAGIQPTVGQARGGMWKATEDFGRRIPIVGLGVKHAQNRATQEASDALLAGAAPAGSETVQGANRAISELFQQAAPQMSIGPFGIRRVGNTAGQLSTDPNLGPVGQNIMNRQRQQLDALRGAPPQGEDLQRLGTSLGDLARDNLRVTSGATERATGRAANTLRQQLLDEADSFMRATGNTEAADTMRDANRYYRQMIPINDAASGAPMGYRDKFVGSRAYKEALADQAGTQTSRLRPQDLPPILSAIEDRLPEVPLTSTPTGGLATSIGTGAGIGALTHFIPGVGNTLGAIAGTSLLASPRVVQKALLGGLRGYAQPTTNAIVAALRNFGINQNEGEGYAP
jgi:hypothetical protein